MDIVTLAAVNKLRYSKPDARRAFRISGGRLGVRPDRWNDAVVVVVLVAVAAPVFADSGTTRLENRLKKYFNNLLLKVEQTKDLLRRSQRHL